MDPDDLSGLYEEIAAAHNPPVVPTLALTLKTNPHPLRHARNAAAHNEAVREGLSCFTGECVPTEDLPFASPFAHGQTLFDTEMRACYLCIDYIESQPPAARPSMYAGIHAKRFRAKCELHGDAWHTAKNRKCEECARAAKGNPDRADARAAGATYKSTCPEHGETEFHPNTGKCLTCFNSIGTPRRVPSARAEARRAGEATYIAACATHGLTGHYVTIGLCATCFNSVGAPRKRGLGTQGPRAAARKAGLASFEGDCSLHGATAHSVAHGKCLTCFTTAGVKRAPAQ